MSQIDDSGSKNRGTSVDVNIVPFIDLMSVLVIFLLITAVWSQVSMIQIGSSIYGKKSQDNKAEPPPRAEVIFRVDIKPFGFRVVVGAQDIQIPKIGQEYDLIKLMVE